MRKLFHRASNTSYYLQILILMMLIGGLGVAYYAELVLGKEPCILCIWTRYAFMIGIAVALVGLFSNVFRFFTFLTILGTLGLSAFHVGVEKKWWKGPDICQAKALNTKGMSQKEAIEALKKHLKNKQPVRCDQINWEIFGVSATIHNTIYLLSMLCLSGAAIWTRNRRRI